MSIHRLSLQNVRNIQKAELELSHKINFFYGDNGAGKTSILEAVNLLGMGKSFRTGRWKQVLTFQSDLMGVYADFFDVVANRSTRLGFQKSLLGGRYLKQDGEVVASHAVFAERLPIQVIAPDGPHLIDDPAEIRRKFLDWGVFHMEPLFLLEWKRCRHILAQRNQLLKNRASAQQLQPWDKLWVEHCEVLHAYRRAYFSQLSHCFMQYMGEQGEGDAYRLELYAGWPENASLEECVKMSHSQDVRQGYTHYGMHRAEIKVFYNSLLAQRVLSRGLRKLLNVRLRLVQCLHLFKMLNKSCICLIDDLAAELDAKNRSRIYQLLASMDVQIWLTGLLPDPLVVDAYSKHSVGFFQLDQGRVLS